MAGVRKLKWDTTFKQLATTLSAGAALASIASYMATRNTAPSSAAAAGLAAVEVSRIDLSPAADTAYSLGDTLHITTLAADAHGQALRAAAVHWTVDDPSVAQVDSTGQVVVRGPGVTGVTVAIGGRAGRARIWVLPRVTALAIAGDSVIRIPEGTTLELHAVASDARGNKIHPSGLGWSVGDVEVAAIDSAGMLRGLAPGTTTIAVATAGLAAERRVEVMPVPASITLTAGADQRAAAGQRLPVPVAVQVVSRSGRPVAGVVVRFDPSAGVGRVEPDSATTDGHGVAVSRWTLGPLPGRQRLAVEVAGIDSALTVAAEADPTPSNTRITMQSDSIVAGAGTTVAGPVAVQVTDSSGVVLADVPVAWRALDGGSFALGDARTDSLGVARAQWHLGPRAGRQRAKVQVGNARTLPPFALSATATAGVATSIVVVSGDAQRGLVGSALARGVVLRALDSLGNPVSGVPIRLSTKAGKVDSMVRTGTGGVASVSWTLGGKAGAARLMARLDGKADSVAITATGRPGAAKTIELVGVPGSGTAGRALPKAVQIVVRDRFGNPVPKVAVRFTVAVGKSSPLQGVTDSAGRVVTHWTLGPKRGKQLLIASV
jgi:adhesin/invasin